MKRLIPIQTDRDQPIPFGTELGDLCPDVLFHELENGRGDRFWAKKWSGSMSWLTPVTVKIEAFLRRLGRRDLCLAVDHSTRFGLVYEFNETLFSSRSIVHYFERHGYFTPEECRAIDELAGLRVESEGLPKIALAQLTDFQSARVGSSMVFLDFEPFPEYATSVGPRDGERT